MNLETLTFLIYLSIAASTTVFLGQSLFHNGQVFLERVFVRMPEVVEPLNRLLLTGFYLINIGFVLAYFSQKTSLDNGLECLEFLGTSLGTVYLILGGMHLFNLLLFFGIEYKFR